MVDYAVVMGIIVAALGSLMLAWRFVPTTAVKCGVCSQKLRLPTSPKKQTFTCKRCKKTLPRRLAYSRDS